MSLASPPPIDRRARASDQEASRDRPPGSIRACVRGSGAALPARVVSNAELATKVDTSDEWIVQRTGIRQRYVAGPDETTSSLALQAAQAALGIVEGAAFDMQAVCSGFVYAVVTADKFLRSGSNKRALVIGAETFSRILDWNDRTTCVLFGDGAGAIVLEARDSDGRLASPGVIASRLRADGRHRDKLYVDGGPSTSGTVGHLRMEGKEVFRHAVGMVTDVIQGCFADAGVTADEIDWFVPHQANRRIIDASADKLGIARDKVVITVDQHGNTSAASIPLALDIAVKDGRIKPGDLVMIEAMGGGFTWGAALIRW
jgi:3-oxoacyl-[acyl-carrier-protein] synthase-3